MDQRIEPNHASAVIGRPEGRRAVALVKVSLAGGQAARGARSRRRFAWTVVISVFAVSVFAPHPRAIAEQSATPSRPTVIVVIGVPGEAEYGDMFAEWAGRWRDAAEQASADFVRIGDSPEGESAPADKTLLKQAIEAHAAESPAELWLVLIGHGTFDGTRALFNLRGEDVSAEELAQWLGPVSRPVAVINCASASAPFIPKLSVPDAGPGRAIVTATQSGFEQNFARFGDAMSAAIADGSADLDKDGQTSLLEAFLAASRATAEFYELGARLATEHALIDDNGDGKGTGADWFRGIRVVKEVAGGGAPDGLRAHQFHLVRSERERNMPPAVRAKRDALELDIAALGAQKPSMEEAAYYARLEALLIELARLYESIDAQEAAAGGEGEVRAQP